MSVESRQPVTVVTRSCGHAPIVELARSSEAGEAGVV
jgi:hypothetical protein